MPYGEIVEDLRDGLAVSADNDARIIRGIKQAARQLLKIYNFPKSVQRAVLPIAAAADSVVLPDDAGKIKAVQLTTVEGGVKLYKILKRRQAGMLPTWQGPNQWEQVGLNLVLDQPMPAVIATPYNIEVWYQTLSEDVAEPWLSVDYQDALEHLAGTKLSLKMRKKEAADIYASLWTQDTKILGTLTSELEFNLMDMSMGELGSDMPGLERYPAG